MSTIAIAVVTATLVVGFAVGIHVGRRGYIRQVAPAYFVGDDVWLTTRYVNPHPEPSTQVAHPARVVSITDSRIVLLCGKTTTYIDMSDAFRLAPREAVDAPALADGAA